MAERAPTLVEPIFIMALIWSIGGTTNAAGRAKFDDFLRAKMKEAKTSVAIPASVPSTRPRPAALARVSVDGRFMRAFLDRSLVRE